MYQRPLYHHAATHPPTPVGRPGGGPGQRGVGASLRVRRPVFAAPVVRVGRRARGGAFPQSVVRGVRLPRGHLLQEEQVPLGGSGRRGRPQRPPSPRGVVVVIVRF